MRNSGQSTTPTLSRSHIAPITLIVVTDDWQPANTTTHQDHVIAHVVGATVLGHFVFDDAIYVLLDIGFVWTIFLDAQMTLLPHPVAIGELELDDQTRSEIQSDIDVLLGTVSGGELKRIKAADKTNFEISDVHLFERADERRLLLICDGTNLAIETSLTTAAIKVYEC